MLLKGNKATVKQSFDKFKKGDVITILEVAPAEFSRDEKEVGIVLSFKETENIYPISLEELGIIKTEKLTEKQILNWFNE